MQVPSLQGWEPLQCHSQRMAGRKKRDPESLFRSESEDPALPAARPIADNAGGTRDRFSDSVFTRLLISQLPGTHTHTRNK